MVHPYHIDFCSISSMACCNAAEESQSNVAVMECYEHEEAMPLCINCTLHYMPSAFMLRPTGQAIGKKKRAPHDHPA
jgi:hypothetical protein